MQATSQQPIADSRTLEALMDARLDAPDHGDDRLHRPGHAGTTFDARQDLYIAAVETFRRVNHVRCVPATMHLWIADRLADAGLLTFTPAAPAPSGRVNGRGPGYPGYQNRNRLTNQQPAGS